MVRKIFYITTVKHFLNAFLLLIVSFALLAKTSLCLTDGKCLADTSFNKDTKPTENKIIHIRDFGAKGNGVTNCTEAFQKAAKYLQANGGTLIIDPGNYIVGKQKLSQNYLAGSAYFAETILTFIEAPYPIKIFGYKAKLKAADGLKYGSFNPITGERDSIRKEGNNSSYYATAFNFINAYGCVSVTIKGITLDGNLGKLNIGPSFGPEGTQLMATGINVYNNRYVYIEDCYIHHCPLDGILIGWTGLKAIDPIYPHTIKNVRSRYNGRQALSWVGGNDLKVINSQFSSTGKALSKGMPVVSKPSAGIDIEIENSIIKNGSFINCRFYDNAGPGIISIHNGITDTYNIHFKKTTFIGTTNSAAYLKTPGLSFDSCVFVGAVERIFGSADKKKAISFKNCLFTMDKKKSPNGKVFGDHCEFYEGKNVIFDNCEFNADTKQLPIFNNREIVFLNCKFYQNSIVNFDASATFKGTTKFEMKGKGKISVKEANFEGRLIYNNRVVSGIKNLKL